MNVPDATAILRAAGLRRTSARVGVIEQLATARRPSSVQDLVARLPSGTDVVTVYRTLNTLVARELARRVWGEDRSRLFELVDMKGKATHVHPHFVCDSCGTVECLQDLAIPHQVPRSTKLLKGYAITKQEVTLHGTCPKCH